MNAAQYIKNVGKSMGYIAIDTFKSMNPAVAEFYANAKEFSTDLYQTIDDFKGKAVGNDSDSIKTKVKSTAAETWQNARDDFLSGKWYNKERKASADNEMLKGMGIDLESAFDLDDFGDWDDDFSTEDKADIALEEKNTQEVVNTVNASVASAANTVAAATAKSTEYMVAIQNENTATMYNLNTKGFNNIGLGLNAINSNLATMLSLAEPLTNHMQNSATFYTKSTEFQQETLSLLRKLVDHVVPDKTGARRTKKSVDDYVGEGGINFAAMFSDMKESISSTVKDLKEMTELFGGGNGISKQISASPISSLISMVLLPMLMPGSNKRSLQWFNKSLKSLGYNAYGKLSNKLDDSLIGGILDLLGFSLPKNTINNKFDTSKYEKGKVDWDGKSRKAVMEVIPYYLSKMTSILEGNNQIEIFNYETGKFETKKEINDRYNKQQKELASSYSYELSSRIKKTNNSINKSDIDELNLILALYGGTNMYELISTNKKTRDDYINKIPQLKEFFGKHRKLRTLIDNAAENSNRGDFNKFDLEEALMEAGNLRSRLREEKEKNEESGEYDSLFRNGRELKSGGLLGGTDALGFNALDYLRGIYINTQRGFGGSSDEISDPIHLGDKAKGRFASKSSTTTTESKAGKTTKSEEKSLKDHFKFSDETWKEITENSKYTDYIKKRYEKELNGSLTADDYDDPMWREIKNIDLKKKIKGKISEFADRFGIGDKLKNFFDAVTDSIKTPAALFDTMITTFRSTLHDIIFSDKGLFGWLFDKEKGVMRKPLQKLFGFVDSRVGTEFGDWFGFNESSSPIPKAYNGRVVKRTGLAAVSEGEIIIPAEFNPNYRKAINKTKQRYNENRTITKFFGGFANGGIAGGASEIDDKENTLIGKSKNLLKQGFIDFGSMLYDTFSDVIGKNDKASREEQKKKVVDVIKGAVDDIKPHAADGILGAMIGGGVSLLTGTVISPILGASLGAATGLVMSSEKVRDFLFGKIETDENGNIKRDGGLFGDTGAKVRQFVEDQLPDTLLGGALGGAGGALLGHPVLGMFLGAGAGFISKSKGIQNFLFGDFDEEGNRKGGLLSKQLQDQIKKIAPGMGAGAVSGLVATAFGGPFGLVGNMLVGSVLGGIASTDSFKDFFFGEKGENGKREGGLVQVIRTSVLDPTRESFFNLTERIRSDFRAIAVGFFDQLKNVVTSIAGGPVGELFRSIGGAVQGIPGFGKLTAKAKDFASLQNLSNRISAGNIRRGINVRDKNGKLLSAKERLALLKDNGFGDNSRILNSTGYKITKMLAGIRSANSLDNFSNFVDEFYGADKETRLQMMSNSKYKKYFENLGIDEKTSKSDLMKMRDAIKVESNARFDPKITSSIDSSITVNNIKEDINEIYKAITGKDKKLFNLNDEIDDSTTEGKQKLNRIQKQDKLYESLMEAVDNTGKLVEHDKQIQDSLIGTDENALNDRESKKTGLLGKFFGEDSVIGKAAKFIADIAKFIPIVTIGGLILTATGVLDKLAEKLGIAGSASNNTVTNSSTGASYNIQYLWQAFGNNGTDVNPEDLSVTFNDTASLSDKAWNVMFKQAPEVAQILKLCHNVAKNQIDDFVAKLAKFPGLQKFLGDKKFSEALADFFNKLLKQTDDVMKQEVKTGAGQFDDVLSGAASAAKNNTDDVAKSFLGSATVVVSVAFAIVDFTAGMQDAETIMKVKKATIPERILCGLLRAIKNDIPYLGIIGGFIPDSWIYNALLNTVGVALGLKAGVDQRREEAQAELDAYNTEHGTDYNWDQYQKGVLDNKTWTERAWEGIKTGGLRTVEAAKDPLGTFNNALNAGMEGSKKGNSLYGKVMYGLGDFNDVMSPGVIGNMSATLFRAWADIGEGDVVGLWKENTEFLGKNTDPISVIMSNLVNFPLLQVKLIGTPLALMNKLIWNVKNGFEEVDFGDSIIGQIAEDNVNIWGHAFAGDIDKMWKYDSDLNSESGFINGIHNVIITAQKVLDTPYAAITWVVKKVWNFFDTFGKNLMSGFRYLDQQANKASELLTSEDTDANTWKDFLKVDEPPTNAPFGKLLKVAGFEARILGLIPQTLKGVANIFLDKVVDPIVNSVTTEFDNMKNDIEHLLGFALEGDPMSSFNYHTTVNASGENTFLGIIGNNAVTIAKIMSIGVGSTIYTAKKVWAVVSPYVEAVQKGLEIVKSEVKTGTEIFESGDPERASELFKVNIDDEAPMAPLFKGAIIGARLIGFPIAVIKTTGNLIQTLVNSVGVAFRSNNTIYKSSIDALKQAYEDDNIDFETFWDMKTTAQFDPKDPLHGIRYYGFTWSKLFMATGKLFKDFFNDIVSNFNFEGIWSNLRSIANYKRGDNTANSGSGSGIGGGSSFVSQIDPRYAGKSLGNSSVGAMGCGPAAASMVLGNSMNANINAARRYQTVGGTDLSYFGDVFAKNGRRPIYYNLSGGASGQDMISDISSGRPVVLMGRDPYNTSKRYSPFGPGNHYVVARGFKNGGIVIDDPESASGGRIYDPSILRSVTAAVGAGSSRLGRGRLFGIGAGGASISSTTDNIWAFFKAKGYSDAAVAGILANIQAESSFSTTVRGDGGAAYGLCQWHNYNNKSSGRFAEMYKLAQNMGKDVSDLEVQLTHIHNEIGQAGAGYTSLSDPYQAGYNFCVNFERPSDKAAKGKYRGNLAKEFYEHYSGTTGSFSGSTSSSSSSSTSGLSSATKPLSAAAKFMSLTSSIGSSISSALGKTIFGKVGSIFSSAFGDNANSNLGSTSITDMDNGSILNNDLSVTSWPGKQPVEYMRDMLGKLQYSTKNRDPEKGGGDCSSTVAWALTKAGIPVTSDSRWQYMNNTTPYTHPSWQNVLWYDNGRPLGKGKDIPVALQPNDVIFYSHGGSNYPDHVDHVEMYNGNGEIIGNGGGVGTRTRPVTAMQDQIIKIARPINSASGSGLDLSDLRPTGRRESTITTNGKIYSISEYRRQRAAGASNLDTTTNTALILKTMLTFIEALVTNTKDIKSIYELLAKYCSGNLSKAETAAALSEMSENSSDTDKIEDSLASLKATVDAILAS